MLENGSLAIPSPFMTNGALFVPHCYNLRLLQVKDAAVVGILFSKTAKRVLDVMIVQLVVCKCIQVFICFL